MLTLAAWVGSTVEPAVAVGYQHAAPGPGTVLQWCHSMDY